MRSSPSSSPDHKAEIANPPLASILVWISADIDVLSIISRIKSITNWILVSVGKISWQNDDEVVSQPCSCAEHAQTLRRKVAWPSPSPRQRSQAQLAMIKNRMLKIFWKDDILPLIFYPRQMEVPNLNRTERNSLALTFLCKLLKVFGPLTLVHVGPE